MFAPRCNKKSGKKWEENLIVCVEEGTEIDLLEIRFIYNSDVQRHYDIHALS